MNSLYSCFVIFAIGVKGKFGILVLFLISVTMSVGQVLDVSDLYKDGNYMFPNFEKVGNDYNFPNYRISSLIEDHAGYLWIGTKDGGLVRFDGYDFTSYKFNPGNANSLSSNDIFFVFEDTRNILWVGTDIGLSYYHPNRKQFINVDFSSHTNPFTIPRNLTCIAETDNGNLIIGSNIGVLELSGISKSSLIGQVEPTAFSDSLNIKIKHLLFDQDNPNINGKLIRDIKFTNDGFIWLLTETELSCINYNILKASSGYLSNPLVCSNQLVTKIDDATKISTDNNGRFYLNNSDSILVLETSGNAINQNIINIANSSFSVNDFSLERDTTALWVGYYDQNLKLLMLEENRLFPLTFESKDLRSLHDFGISSFLRTSSGVIFIGTAWGGLYKYNPNDIIDGYHPGLQLIHQNQASNLRYVFEDSDSYLWLVAEDIYRCDKNTGEIIKTFSSDFFGHSWSYTNKIIESSNGSFWIGSESRGLVKVDIENDQLGTPSSNWNISKRTVIDNKTITSLYETSDGEILVATVFTDSDKAQINTELYRLTNDGEIVNIYPVSGCDIRNGNEIDVLTYQIYCDSNQVAWLATGGGLTRIDLKSNTKDVFTNQHNESNDNILLSVYPDPGKNEILWLGYASGGLYCFDTGNEDFMGQKLINTNRISSILDDTDGNLWLGTDEGITKIILDTSTSRISDYTNYNVLDGLITGDFTNYYGPNSFKTSDGKLIFTGSRGFQVIDPNISFSITRVPPVMITDFTLNYKPADYGEQNSPLSKSILLTENISLRYDENTLGFEITSIDFRSPSSLQYAYMLKGYDEDWIQNHNQRNIQYTKLPPGTYTLLLRVSSYDSGWSEESEALIIEIRNPWWTSSIAYIFYLMLLIGVVLTVDRIQRTSLNMKAMIRLNRVEAEKLRELDAMKSRFFANISHEFKTPLTLILNPVNEMLSKAHNTSINNSLVLIKRNARRLQEYINEILELSKLDAHRLKLNIREFDIVRFLKYQLSSFESLAKQENISLIFDPPVKEIICYLDPNMINKIISNLLLNSIKFTPPGGKIEISLSGCYCNEHDHCAQKKGCLIISVRDTGIGIPEEKIPRIFERYYKVSDDENDYGTGLGLALVKELVTLHNGSINVVSKENKFTMFQLHFPMGKNHFSPEDMADITRYEIEEDFYPSDKKLESPKERPASSENNEKIVLVIEDNEDMRTLINAGLKRDFNVVMAKDGQEGIDKALEISPDLILCDVMMPKKDGVEVARMLKLNEITSHIPIILLTAKSQMSDKITGLETGADDYVIKPFFPAELKTRIKNLLKQREKLRNKFSRRSVINTRSDHIVPIDQLFLDKVIAIINEQLKDENFGVQTILDELNISRTQLHRKLKALLDLSANELIQNVRLQKASELLKNKAGTVAEICYEVGFNSPPTFTRLFKKHFGHTPSEHTEQ